MKEETKKEINKLIVEITLKPELAIEGLRIIKDNKGTDKYTWAKALGEIAQEKPDLLLPYFTELQHLLDHPNNFIKWGGIALIAELLRKKEITTSDKSYHEYMHLLEDKSMITAANCAKGSVRILKNQPELEEDITERLLKSTKHDFESKGKLSPECQNIYWGHLLDLFEEYYDLIGDKKRILAFAASCCHNSRKAVAKKAGEFLKKHLLDFA